MDLNSWAVIGIVCLLLGIPAGVAAYAVAGAKSPALTTGGLLWGNPFPDRRRRPVKRSAPSVTAPVADPAEFVMSFPAICHLPPDYWALRSRVLAPEGIAEGGRDYGIDDATRDIMREAAKRELSRGAEKALQRYVREGVLDTDEAVIALAGVRAQLTKDRLAELRLIAAEAKLAAVAADPAIEVPPMEPVPG